MENNPEEFGQTAGLVDMAEFPKWIIYEDENFLALNKPGWLVCHPSKNGPLSSLVGAAREYLGAETLHPVSRLDRETSGVVVIAKNYAAASKAQKAVSISGAVKKTYLAFMEGKLGATATISQPLADDKKSLVSIKTCCAVQKPSAKSAVTIFRPLSHSRRGGRRVHAVRGIASDRPQAPDTRARPMARAQRRRRQNLRPRRNAVSRFRREGVHARNGGNPPDKAPGSARGGHGLRRRRARIEPPRAAAERPARIRRKIRDRSPRKISVKGAGATGKRGKFPSTRARGNRAENSEFARKIKIPRRRNLQAKTAAADPRVKRASTARDSQNASLFRRPAPGKA